MVQEFRLVSEKEQKRGQFSNAIDNSGSYSIINISLRYKHI